jgi:YVTN family beta-propeller protein
LKNKLSIAIWCFLLFDFVLFGVFIFGNKSEASSSLEDEIVLDSAISQPVMQNPTKIEKKNFEKLPVRGIELLKSEKIKTGLNVKSVLFSPDGKYLYSINLEGGSVYEFERATRKITRKLIFKQTPAKGYDYEKRKWIANSFEEKPVEACFSHNGKYLWVSLHNAKGIVAWNLRDTSSVLVENTKLATLNIVSHSIGKLTKAKSNKIKLKLPFFKTGETPKVMTLSKNGKQLFVANWHSNTVSVLDISSSNPNDWNKTKDISVGSVPRGMCASENGKFLFVGHMGSNTVGIVSLDSFKLIKSVKIGVTPRHIISNGKDLFTSLSSPEKIVRLGQDSLKVLQTVSTKDDPRTISLSEDHKFLFSVSYADDLLEVLDAKTLKVLRTEKSSHKPVGVTVFQQADTIEAWVGNYSSSNISVFTYRVNYEPFLVE